MKKSGKVAQKSIFPLHKAFCEISKVAQKWHSVPKKWHSFYDF